jgi:ParB family transcriptional regulator, chromosome partitioning protein
VNSKRRALGRGLAALIPAAAEPEPKPIVAQPAEPVPVARPTNGLAKIPIEEIHPSNVQPRQVFDETALKELTDSIREQGIIQPIAVRPRKDGGYEIVAGERRWRAAQRAGLREVPAVIVHVETNRAFEMALVENLQRADLNPIEEAEGFQRLIAEFSYTQEKLATRVGKDRSTVANALRLLRLPEKVRTLVTEGRLSMGHARALLGLEQPIAIEQLARQAVSRNLSVRAVETLVRKARPGQDASAAERLPPKASPAARDLTDRLQKGLGTRVKVVESGPGQGHLEIFYHSLDELDRILARLLPSK